MEEEGGRLDGTQPVGWARDGYLKERREGKLLLVYEINKKKWYLNKI